MSRKIKRTVLKYTPGFIVKMYKKTFTRVKTERKNSSVSFSENGEDLLIQKFFREKKKGFYVDVGAFHPIKKSNTYLFYKKGWKGINIEANNEYIQLFKWMRGLDSNINAAISDEKKILTYYKFNTEAVNTFDETHADYWSQKVGSRLEEKIEIETTTLKEVLDQYMEKGQQIDFMSVDVEGMDLKVLRSNDWVKYRPQMLLVEDNDHGLEDFRESKIYTYVTGLRYRLCCITGPTMIFKDMELSN